MSRLSKDERTAIIIALVEGNSLRVTARMRDVALNIVLRKLPEIGETCTAAIPVQMEELGRKCHVSIAQL